MKSPRYPVTPCRGGAAGPLRSTLLLSLLLVLTACGPAGSVEEQIEAQINAMEAAGEAGERGAFMRFVAEDFEGQGGMLRDDFRNYLFLQLNERRRLQAQVFPVTVIPEGPNLAQARFKLLVTGGAGLIPEEGELLSVDTRWVLEDGDWLLWRARWEPLTP